MARILVILLILCSLMPALLGQPDTTALDSAKNPRIKLRSLLPGPELPASPLNEDSLIAVRQQLQADSLAAMWFHDDFSANGNQWRITNSSKQQTEITDGSYWLRSKDADALQFFLQPIPSRDAGDFYLELAIAHEGGPSNQGYGLVWGVSDDFQSYYALLISANRKYTILRVENGRYKDIKRWTESKLVNGSGKLNQLGMYRRDDLLEFYLNGRMVFKNRYEPTPGETMGILLNGKLKLRADHFFLRDPSVWPSPSVLLGRK